MTCCDYIRVRDVIDNYGTDWSELEFNGLDVLGQDLSSIVLPNNLIFSSNAKI